MSKMQDSQPHRCLKLRQDSAVGQWLFLEAVRPEAMLPFSRWAQRQVETHSGCTAYLAAPPPVCQMACTLVPGRLPTPSFEADASGCRVSRSYHLGHSRARLRYLSFLSPQPLLFRLLHTRPAPCKHARRRDRYYLAADVSYGVRATISKHPIRRE